MDAIDKMIAALNKEALEKRTRLASVESARISEEMARKWEKKESALQLRAEQTKKAAEKKYQQALHRQVNEAKQEQVLQQQAYLTQLFAQAFQRMTEWSPEELRIFAQRALIQLPISTSGTFHAGPDQAHVLDGEWLASCQSSLTYQIAYGSPLTEAGFLVDDHGIQYNFTYQMLLEEYKQQTRERWLQMIQKGG
jgi:V/A-type H+/Na+-transporting ATPase subunit E